MTVYGPSTGHLHVVRHHATVKVIRCDCGFEAAGDGDEELVARAQAHAQDAHGTDLPAELVLGLARPRPLRSTEPSQPTQHPS